MAWAPACTKAVKPTTLVIITKQGRKELRHALVEAAWTAISSQPYWREQYQKLSHRIPATKAIVAIARRLLVVVWHVLTERAAESQSQPGYGCL